jgi:uncharacterized protein (TIGR02145 family)
MKKTKTIITLIGASVLLFSCANNASNNDNSRRRNSEQKISTTEGNENSGNLEGIKIGEQTWAVANLDVNTFRNGDVIPEAKTDGEWVKVGKGGKPAWCYYDNDPANGKKYGKLYNWFAVTDPRGLAPNGWHVPSDAEWTKLTDNLGGEAVAGKKMKNTSGWENDGNGTNTSGFAGLPGGFRSNDGAFGLIGINGGWWSSTELITYNAWFCILSGGNGKISRNDGSGQHGLSVRCLKD